MQLRSPLIILLLAAALSPDATQSISLVDTLYKGVHLFSNFISYNPDSPLSPIYKFFSDRISMPIAPQRGDPGERDDGRDEQDEDIGPWGPLFRALGFTSRQMSAFAVDFMVFLAQFVSNSFATTMGRRRGKRIHKPLLEMVLEQPKISRMLSVMQDPNLMQHVLLEIDGRMSEANNECVQQLICRMSPVVKGMQASLAFFLKQKVFVQENPERGDTGSSESRNGETILDLSEIWPSLTPMERLLFFMPSFDEFMNHGEPCRRKYSNCVPS